MSETKNNQTKIPHAPESSAQTIWRELLHVAIVGNGIFPQSFWTQGVLLADKMTELVNNGDATWHSLLKSNPPSDLIDTMLGEARDKSHNAYKFKSAPGMMRGPAPLFNVWENGKSHATTFLSNLAHAINSDTPRQMEPVTHYKDAPLEEITSNPEKNSLLRELLKVASRSLSDEEIKELSGKYKKRIGEFMQKYTPYSFSNTPDDYREEQKSLDQELELILENATSLTQQQMIKCLEGKHPQHKSLLETIRNYDPDKLFGGVGVARIHPLKHPDYE